MKKIVYYISILCLLAGVYSCSMAEKGEMDSGSNSSTGRAGSLARFNVVNDYLYTVDPVKLHAFSLADKEHPARTSEIGLGIYTETIFAYDKYLLLGTDNGMHIFDISLPSMPVFKKFFQHIRSCDPVVAQAGYAYLTLNASNQRCFNGQNQLQIIDMKDIMNPVLLKTLSLSMPLGLDINNDTLYVCDKGLRVFDVKDKQNPKELFYDAAIAANDVICLNNTLIVVGEQGLHQYRNNNGKLEKISTILIQQ